MVFKSRMMNICDDMKSPLEHYKQLKKKKEKASLILSDSHEMNTK